MIKCFILFLVLLLSVISDIRISKIRNIYVMAAVLSGLTINTYFYGLYGFMESIKGIVLPILLMGIFFYARLIGAGDIKLFCGIGAVMGSVFVLSAMAYSFLLCGVYAFITLLMKSKVISTFHSFLQELELCFFTQSISAFEYKKTRTTVRMSPAIAAGCVFQVLINIF